MRSVRAFVVTSSILSAGCSIHPLPEDFAKDSTVAIVHKIRCEARKAVEARVPGTKYDTAGIAYKFTFTLTEKNDASGSATFGLPFTNGTFNLSIGAGETKERLGEREFVIVEDFKELKNERCALEATRSNYRYPITGTVGLGETISTFVDLTESSLLEQATAQQKSFIDTLEFTTTVSANLDPSVDLNPVKDRFRLNKASAKFSGSRIDKHRLVVSLSIPTPLSRDSAKASPKARALQGLENYEQKFLRIDGGSILQLR